MFSIIYTELINGMCVIGLHDNKLARQSTCYFYQWSQARHAQLLALSADWSDQDHHVEPTPTSQHLILNTYTNNKIKTKIFWIYFCTRKWRNTEMYHGLTNLNICTE